MTTSTLPKATTSAGRLIGRTAVVTGAGRGIGQTLALRLAAEGARIAVVDLADGTDTRRAVEAAGGVAAAFEADVSDPAQVRRLVAEIADAVGAPDIVVNNAGIYPFIKLDEITIDAWRRVFAVNLESQLLAAQAFYPAMKEKGWGRIINISSNTVGLQIPDSVRPERGLNSPDVPGEAVPGGSL